MPTENGHAGDSHSEIVGQRAALAARHLSGCCAVVAKAKKDGWVCLACPEIHVVPRPGWYSPENYKRRERVRRAVAVIDGKCAECGRPVSAENRRLCSRHRAMAAARKRKARGIRSRAGRESLYGDRGTGYADGGAVFIDNVNP